MRIQWVAGAVRRFCELHVEYVAWLLTYVALDALTRILVFIRSLSLHLQICWQIVPGQKFFWISIVSGWLLPCIFLALSLALPGVSYRFGQICHINHTDSMGTFWAPLLIITGLSAFMQFSTFGYCIRVYLRSLMDPSNTTTGSSNMASSGLPSTKGASSIKTVSARAAYRRVRKVIALQWRGIMVVMILIISIVYFSVIFLKLDNSTVKEAQDPASAQNWLACLVEAKGDKNKCLDQVSSFVVNEAAVMAVLFLIASMGYWCVLLLGRGGMFLGWYDLARRPFESKEHFVSADARRYSDPRNYEMLTNANFELVKGPTPVFATTTALKDKELDIEGGRDEPKMGSPVVRELSPAPSAGDSDDRRDSEARRIASLNFSLPLGHHHTTSDRVTFSRESDRPLSRFSETASDLEDPEDLVDELHTATLHSPIKVGGGRKPSSVYSGHWDRSSPMLATERSLTSVVQGYPSSTVLGSPQAPTSNPTSLGRERSNSALGREWSVGKASPVIQAPRPTIIRANSARKANDMQYSPRSPGTPEPSAAVMVSPGRQASRPIVTRNISVPIQSTEPPIEWDPTSSYARSSAGPTGKSGGVEGWS